jgi:hypothetical protein
LEYFEFEKWAACALCAATGKIFTPEFDGFIRNSIGDYWLSYWLDIRFVRRVSFIYCLRKLFNYTLIGGENAVDSCKIQRLVYEEGKTKRI